MKSSQEEDFLQTFQAPSVHPQYSTAVNLKILRTTDLIQLTNLLSMVSESEQYWVHTVSHTLMEVESAMKY